MKRLLTALAIAAALATSAHATVYTQVQPDKSSIEFSYSQMGVPMDGRFRKFSSQLSFDPAQPANRGRGFNHTVQSLRIVERLERRRERPREP